MDKCLDRAGLSGTKMMDTEGMDPALDWVMRCYFNLKYVNSGLEG